MILSHRFPLTILEASLLVNPLSVALPVFGDTNYRIYNVVCSLPSETIVSTLSTPTIANLTFSPTILSSFTSTPIAFKLTLSLSKPTYGLSQLHLPSIYLTNIRGQVLEVPLNLDGSPTGDQIECSGNITVPYMYGFGGEFLAVGVYGIIDNALNPLGYDTADLLVALPNIINNGVITAPKMDWTPKILHIVDKITQSGGNSITVNGCNFGSLDKPLPVVGYFDLMDGSTPIQVKSFATKQLGVENQYQIIFTQPQLKSDRLSLYVSDGLGSVSISTNSIILVSKDFIYQESLFPCPKDSNDKICGGNGVCTKTGCQCSTGYTGSGCTSVKIPHDSLKMEFNQDKPSLNIEISIDGDTLKSYPLNDWDYVGGFNSNRSSTLYNYTTVIRQGDNTTSTINVTIEHFNTTSDVMIDFADANFTVQDSTIKYTISMSNYSFSSRLNTLQLIMDSVITRNTSSDSCSSSESGSFNGAENDVAWIQLRVDSVSLYVQCIKNAEADDRTIYVTNKILEESILLNGYIFIYPMPPPLAFARDYFPSRL
ncbi:hypothetical protein DFA_02861 [Cavenderia fasciculata]|uniref:EGF-like domain-containing protein n=1 Tax=Cavenderia fasciculata TaxID=261658 RepID=F4PIN8_CACFS|nr:uncharacterized protein DFA_02861 [Cavenderia fasciculata]EGG24618.1 hypothetical protein DFA_02861 [Cavenderia fasciculata]|eukprot:XP_004362469.1 hypothetical protein DFA_02861 [Cavenderia fasciculata]